MRRIRIKGVNDMKEYAFGIDLGGTTAKVGLFTTSGKLLEKWEVSTDTSNNGAHILENLAAAVQQKMQEKGLSADKVEGVGLGVPGPVLDSSIVPIVCANLGGWGNRNVSIELSELLGGIRVLVGNDANVAALGEIWMGAAQGCRSAVMVTLGTGVGGGVIVNGKVIDGAHGAGGEIGHITVNPHETAVCGCGKRGCLEQYSSATGVVRCMKKLLDANPDTACTLRGKDFEAKDVFDAARAGDALAAREVDEMASTLGMALANIAATTKEFGESTVSKILDLVENSSMKKARAENFITRFARVYTPAVCYGALALALLPPVVLLLMGQPARFGDWVYRALTFLVISCPCALVISIPLSFFGGIGGASSCGILIKGSTYLEELANTGIVVFDKTGTLTQGTFKVTGIHPAEGVTDAALVEAAALAESWSKHPISLSIKAAYGKPIDAARVTDVQELGGHGVTAKVDGKSVAAGNARLMEKLGLAVPAVEGVGTIVHVAVEGSYTGYLLISDVVKPHSADAIRALKASGVRKTVMLTGDAQPVAQAVAQQLGLDEYHAGLLPGDKVDQIEKLLAAKQPKENLAFVGDGINDAPVLSRADVGIAMGALGSDAAIEAADVVLMDDDPAKIALAMRIARRTLRIVHQNIVFALGIKALCLLLGALGIAGMWAAIFADVGVMVIAVLNATRALYTKDLTKN